jgi:glutathione synthase/RimK-type ligase-like ATP-grasp enzyme
VAMPGSLYVSLFSLDGYSMEQTCGGDREASDGEREPRSALLINGPSLQAAEKKSVPVLVDGVDTVFRSVDDLAFTIGTDRVRVYETVSERDLADFGVVHIIEYPRPTATLISALADYLQIRKVPAVNVAGIGPPTKLFQYLRLAQAGLPVPMTVYRSPKLLASSYSELTEKLGLPFVLKAMSTSNGRFNYLISREDDLVQYLQNCPPARRFLAQEFIPNDVTIRLLVFGGKVSVAMQRTGTERLYPTNTARGGNAVLLALDELDPVAVQLAIRATSFIGYDVAGVNLIQNWTTGCWYVLDVNTSPAIGTGAFVPEKLNAYSSYLKRKLAVPFEVDDRRIQRGT